MVLVNSTKTNIQMHFGFSVKNILIIKIFLIFKNQFKMIKRGNRNKFWKLGEL